MLAEPIDAPLFVVGPPRTGTTILLELLALDPSLRAPLAWEAVQPLPRLDDPVADVAERRRLAEAEQEFWADIDPEFMTMHELASDLPCECVHFLAYDFAGPYWSMLYDTPSFTGWQLEHLETLGRVYRLHRRMLQTFQHGDDPRRWLLKSPAHVSTLPQLFAEYPDALVIHTHRDPRKFIASLVSLLGVVRGMRSDAVDVAALGPLMEMTYQFFLEGAIAAARGRHRARRTGSSTRSSSTSWPIRWRTSAGSTSSSGSTGPPATTAHPRLPGREAEGQARRAHGTRSTPSASTRTTSAPPSPPTSPTTASPRSSRPRRISARIAPHGVQIAWIERGRVRRGSRRGRPRPSGVSIGPSGRK